MTGAWCITVYSPAYSVAEQACVDPDHVRGSVPGISESIPRIGWNGFQEWVLSQNGSPK